MGDIAEMMLDGLLCEICGDIIDFDESWFPRTCNKCLRVESEYERNG